jgi:hypothetical protein
LSILNYPLAWQALWEPMVGVQLCGIKDVILRHVAPFDPSNFNSGAAFCQMKTIASNSHERTIYRKFNQIARMERKP